MKEMKKHTRILLGALGFFVVLSIVLFSLLLRHGILHTGTAILRDHNEGFSLTNPILDCEVASSGEESIISRGQVSEIASQMKRTYDIDQIAIYFRDLNNGPWVGVMEKEFFSPASLLKTPLYIAYLRYVQDHPDVAEKKVIVTAKDMVPVGVQMIKPQQSAILGQSYTLDQLAAFSIQYSDNVSTEILSRYVPPQYLNDVYQSIGADYNGPSEELEVRVKDFASFFRVLYNASYLTRDLSEKALQLFARSTFTQGIVAGVPDSVTVAHKFGERGDITEGGRDRSQLHDCGIIYHRTSPYILCVMTRGGTLEKQQQAIADISRFFYKEVDTQ